jgi:diguanylate cyclase (GGDEF)-like protein
MPPKRLYLVTLISATMLILVMSFLFYLSNKLLIERSSLIEAVEEIKLEATTAHLWFEEIMSGDSTESIENVWEGIASADWYAKAMLEGGKNSGGTYYPLTNPTLRDLIIEVRKKLTNFKLIAIKRYDSFEESIPGTDIDTQFDRVFNEFIKQANTVESHVKFQIKDEFKQYQYISFTLIFISALISILLSNFLYKREKQRVSLIESLTEATKSIANKNKELHTLAHYDSLTGLPNRILFLDRLDQAIIHAMRSNSSIVILFLDLDYFKSVNDQYGHQCGDNLLQQVSQRITKSIRGDDTAVRISGDEFVVILNELDDVSSAVNTANRVAEQLIETLQTPFQLNEPVVYISASIGISIYPEDSTNGEELTKFADNAMYHAKSLGKNNFQFYSKEFSRQSMLRLEVERDLRTAIEEDQFVLHFHPQWQLKTNVISGLEVLVRWQHPTSGLVYPDEFIGVAESCGLILKLDTLIMRKALEQHKLWLDSKFNYGIMSINVSPVSFCHKDFIEKTQQLIMQSSISPKTIELEILESVLVENNDNSQQTLHALKELGIRVAIDDFGTGYSSMAYLKNFEVDTLKIDRGFITDSTRNETSKVILKNMITLGNELGLKVIAEGIETVEQEEIIKQFNCEIGQGYLLTKPLPCKEIENIIQVRQSHNVVSIKTVV